MVRMSCVNKCYGFTNDPAVCVNKCYGFTNDPKIVVQVPRPAVALHWGSPAPSLLQCCV